MGILHVWKYPALGDGKVNAIKATLHEALVKRNLHLATVQTEYCFYVEVDQDLTDTEKNVILWLLSTPFQNDLKSESHFSSELSNDKLLVEIGPRLNFSTPFSTNAVSICQSVGLSAVKRVERSVRYLITVMDSDNCTVHVKDNPQLVSEIVNSLHDRMTECQYRATLSSFDLHHEHVENVFDVDVLGVGKVALEKANKQLGLAMDDWDIDYYTKLFVEKVNRNPTSIECFDLAQSNSEHSRHWFFKGACVVDGVRQDDSLFALVMSTQKHSNPNNVIKFCDNSSGISGWPVKLLCPTDPTRSSAFGERDDITRHIIFTAETHNFPTGVAPFPGATTGTGGRIRDVQSTGRGAHVIAGTAGYSFGNLHIPGYKLPWEDDSFSYPRNFAMPLQIAVEASNGASDYGNKFGEPVLAGFARSFGQILPNGDRREWIKPIMFSGGIGSLDHWHVKKSPPALDMNVIKLGGPVYRIGVGGGAASSIQVQGDNVADLDFGAVQRGDAEMEQKLNRIIRACIEMGDNNPIQSIHDQGAGGNGNVLKEICEPAGAVIKASGFELGDPTISLLELWGAEYQESNAALVRQSDVDTLQLIGQRERCSVSVVGHISGDGKIVLEDDRKTSSTADKKRPVDLELELVLGSMPQKVYNLDHVAPVLRPLQLPDGLRLAEALHRVLRLPSVASKRYLTNKVDRSVTGLVAQQQCVGPLHTPLADVAVVALSHFDTVGGATALGEQPIKGLVDAGCGARMSVGEALTNLIFARITDIRDVKCSGNWMWAAKLAGEGALLYDACKAMCDVMARLGIAVDGGKDSLSMAARVGDEVVKAPGTLVVSAYVGCPDITCTVTPDLKCPHGKGALLYVALNPGDKHRCGGSALAQCFSQIGDCSPDMDDPELFVNGFKVTQALVKNRLLRAGHDVSDGGLVTCVLEMAFAGNCSVQLDLHVDKHVDQLDYLFAEELGVVLEVDCVDVDQVVAMYVTAGLSCQLIGHSLALPDSRVVIISVNGSVVLEEDMCRLRKVWEETSYRLELLQANPACVQQERDLLAERTLPPYALTEQLTDFVLHERPAIATGPRQHRVAVVREEGSNGDREMAAAFHMAGFEVWDVNMVDLSTGRVTLDGFRGVAFVGGFSFADVLGSAKGWAAAVKFNERVSQQFDRFYAREDTFSLGVCNGCQLMTLLGWVAPLTAGTNEQGVYMDHNLSGRYESRFVTVRIDSSPAMMLKGLEGCSLGVWVAHGEGRMVFKTESLHRDSIDKGLIPVKYVDDSNIPTNTYPLNPNGSPGGAAGLCSADGRHLALMPHPERCVLPWQWPWMPSNWRQSIKTSPWLRMFINAYAWCE